MMKKLRIYIIFQILLIGISGYSQRFSTGYTWKINALNQRKAPQYIAPPYSYHIYYSEASEINFVNSAGFGLVGSVDYKKFVLFSGVQAEIARLKAHIVPNNGTNMDGKINHSSSYFILDRGSLVFPLQLIYKAGAQTKKCFIMSLGISYQINTYKERFNHIHLNLMDSELIPGYDYLITEYEMYQVLYNEHNFLTFNAGIGWKYDNSYTTLELNRRFGFDESKFPQARYLNINLSFIKFLNFQNLHRGYKIYLD